MVRRISALASWRSPLARSSLCRRKLTNAAAVCRSTDISGDYAAMARAFGGYGERITRPEEIVPAIRRGIQKTQEGIPVLLEFITSKETEVSRPGT